jgi:Tfp pilus assembly protein FimT
MFDITSSTGPAPVRRRRGVTLLELLVALVLLDFGLIALVGAAASASRLRGRAHGDGLALDVASGRLEQILAVPCRGAAAGMEAPTRAMTEWWSDEPAPNGTRTVSDSVVVAMARGESRTVVLHGAGRC